MKSSVLMIAGALALVPSLALAGNPAFCKEDTKAGDYELQQMKTSEVDQILGSVAALVCSNDAAANAHRADIDKARDEWTKKLHLVDSDWADLIALRNAHFNFPTFDLSANTLGGLTPVDQYSAIKETFRGSDGATVADRLYLADAFGSQLSEAGRVALLQWCYDGRDNIAQWAVCQGDADQLDLGKLEQQLRGDTAHPPEARAYILVQAAIVQDQGKKIADKIQAMIKKDDTYKKVMDTAAKGRADWAKGIGTNKQLLELVASMDSATFFHSRKQLAGCEGKTAAALAAAVSKIPAKTFASFHDSNDDPYKGFAHDAGRVLVTYPEVNLAANAYTQCRPKSPIGDWMAYFNQEVPGVRGPRNAAIGALMGESFTFDDTRAGKLDFPKFDERPYARRGGEIRSETGVVKSIKVSGDKATISEEKTIVKSLDCVKWHNTNRIQAIRDSGEVVYESLCDKTEMRSHDMTPHDYPVSAETSKMVKPGMVISYTPNGDGRDVIAVWPSKTAKNPSYVLGGAVK